MSYVARLRRVFAWDHASRPWWALAGFTLIAVALHIVPRFEGRGDVALAPGVEAGSARATFDGHELVLPCHGNSAPPYARVALPTGERLRVRASVQVPEGERADVILGVDRFHGRERHDASWVARSAVPFTWTSVLDARHRRDASLRLRYGRKCSAASVLRANVRVERLAPTATFEIGRALVYGGSVLCLLALAWQHRRRRELWFAVGVVSFIIVGTSLTAGSMRTITDAMTPDAWAATIRGHDARDLIHAVGHFSGFAGLGVLAARTSARLLPAFALLAVTTEVFQSLRLDRSGSASDVAVDLAGLAGGWVLAIVVGRVVRGGGDTGHSDLTTQHARQPWPKSAPELHARRVGPRPRGKTEDPALQGLRLPAAFPRPASPGVSPTVDRGTRWGIS